jgi:hypothetical protein
MPTNEHYFIEQTNNGRYAVRAKSFTACKCGVNTQQEAIARVKELNRKDQPDVERFEIKSGGRDQWRASK